MVRHGSRKATHHELLLHVVELELVGNDVKVILLLLEGLQTGTEG